MARKGNKTAVGHGAPKGNTNAKKDIPNLWEQVDNLLKINCTGEEIAAVLNIDYDTLAKRCVDEKKCLYSEYIKKGNQNFKTSLKRLQWRSAQGDIKEIKDEAGNVIEKKVIIQPNVTMQIWLGKQYLNQSDKIENTIESAEPITGFIIECIQPENNAKESQSLPYTGEGVTTT